MGMLRRTFNFWTSEAFKTLENDFSIEHGDLYHVNDQIMILVNEKCLTCLPKVV